MKIDGKTRVCGLIGNPVEHTLSPLIHNHLAEMTGQNMVYVPFRVAEDSVEAAVKGAYALNIQGLNVTVPHKSAVMPWLQETDALAQKISAVNTLVRTGGGYKGYNTDMPGLLRAMQSEGIQIKGETVLLLGAGGAARAVAFLCVSEGAERVYVYNRTFEKAQQVAAEVNAAFGTDCVRAVMQPQELEEERFLAIQGTSVGLHPNVQQTPLPDSTIYDRIHTGVDLIYRPAQTRFMQLVEAHGGKTMNGLKMLLYQGIIAYELWNEMTVTEAQAQEILKKMKEEMGINE